MTREPKGFILMLPVPNTDRHSPLMDGRTGEPVYFPAQDLRLVQLQRHCELAQVAHALGVKRIEVRT